MTVEEMISVKFACDVIATSLVVIFIIWCLKKRKWKKMLVKSVECLSVREDCLCVCISDVSRGEIVEWYTQFIFCISDNICYICKIIQRINIVFYNVRLFTAFVYSFSALRKREPFGLPLLCFTWNIYIINNVGNVAVNCGIKNSCEPLKVTYPPEPL